MTTDLFDLVFKEWSRPVKEVKGYNVIKSDKGYVVVINALGISKEDLSIDLSGKYLSVKGETKIEEIDFTNKVSYQFYVGDLDGEIDTVEYRLNDGFLYVDIKLKQTKNKVKIVYKD
jgi:HSP20 family molecular chaperone IbpA